MINQKFSYVWVEDGFVGGDSAVYHYDGYKFGDGFVKDYSAAPMTSPTFR